MTLMAADDPVGAFVTLWVITADGSKRLRGLPQALREHVIKNFNPGGSLKPGTTWDGKLIVFLASLEKAGVEEKGKGGEG